MVALFVGGGGLLVNSGRGKAVFQSGHEFLEPLFLNCYCYQRHEERVFRATLYSQNKPNGENLQRTRMFQLAIWRPQAIQSDRLRLIDIHSSVQCYTYYLLWHPESFFSICSDGLLLYISSSWIYSLLMLKPRHVIFVIQEYRIEANVDFCSGDFTTAFVSSLGIGKCTLEAVLYGAGGCRYCMTIRN